MINFTKLHYAVGIIFGVVFLLTGVYMLVNFPELYDGREEIRMMFRATHIYILFSVLVNLMTANYCVGKGVSRYPLLSGLASWLILITPIVFFIAFMFEPPAYLIDRPISFWGVVSLVAGVVLHSLLNTPLLKAKL